MSASKQKGTSAERAVANYLARTAFPDADRRPLSGAKDKGDIGGVGRLVFEVKAAKAWQIAQWLRETEQERVNAEAHFGILVYKPPGLGLTKVGQWLTFMDWFSYLDLLDLRALRLHHDGTFLAAPKVRLETVAAVSQPKAAEVLTTAERIWHKSLVGVRVARRRSSAEMEVVHAAQAQQLFVPHPGYYHLMRLEARCRLLVDAGYGSREMMDAATSSILKDNADDE